MTTWVIVYRGSDQLDHELATKAPASLDEHGAAILVRNFLRLQELSKLASADAGFAALDVTDIEIMSLRKAPDSSEVTR